MPALDLQLCQSIIDGVRIVHISHDKKSFYQDLRSPRLILVYVVFSASE